VIGVTDQAHAVETSHPPRPFLITTNAVMRVLLRSPLAGRAGRQFMLLDFAGRKTGRGYTVPVAAHRHNGDLLALTDARWRLNFRGGGDADVTLERKTTHMVGELIEDPATVGSVYANRLAALGLQTGPRQLGLKVNGDRLPTIAEFTEAALRDHLSIIQLKPRD
jgi:hypothetical protein